jgi:NAD(P)-dependent dehydrogenase (short-subunit alcohol dehydrogenase family)
METQPSMEGKVVVITGATSGIGKVAAERLAARGARIVAVARDRKRGEDTLAALRKIAPKPAHSMRYADLSLLSEMKRVANEIAAAESRIDVLINNAGAIFEKRQLTREGLEMTFATNHIAYFVLTQILKERLIASGPSRVVNTSSEAHRRMRLDFDDLQGARSYKAFREYGRSKLCNILFTRELARTLRGTNVTANCLHPGFVNTRFGDQGTGALTHFFRIAKKLAISPEKGAETIVYLASSTEVASISGEYFFKCHLKTPSNEARDDEAARRLWRETSKISGMN